MMVRARFQQAMHHYFVCFIALLLERLHVRTTPQ